MVIRILLLGSGGREHALVWKLAQSNLVDRIYVCPGNGGTSGEPKTSNLDHLPASDFPKLVEWAVANEVRNPPGIRFLLTYALIRSHSLFLGQSNL
jgi:phosphoribosylamine--glycine ligase/phosphoribosylformylglycinamidine cyclo-ligase